MMRSLFKGSYRFIQGQIVRRYVLPFFFSSQRVLESFSSLPDSSPQNGIQGRVWFHAASVGELEVLWPLILLSAEKGQELLVTILSESAHSSLKKLRGQLGKQGQLIFAGYAPWEGQWISAFDCFHPSLFVTAKYEAWPDLWISLAEKNIPLAIVSVKARKSLRIAKIFCHVLLGSLPRLFLFPCLRSDLGPLKALFPEAHVEVAGEPRWDRVYSRSRGVQPRVSELIQKHQDLPKPWGVIGSAWLADLQFLEPALSKVSGTLWVVPHKIDDTHCNEIEAYLKEHHFDVIRTSKSCDKTNTSTKTCIFVDELGFLSELYSVVSWAFVGGGFGAGVHSTIEPAIHGIPLAVGPAGSEKFSEIQELTQSGQLSILRNETELLQWLSLMERVDSSQRQKWMSDGLERRGAAQKIFTAIENLI